MIDDKLKAIKVPTKVKYEIGGPKEGTITAWVQLPPAIIKQIKQIFKEKI